MPKNPAMLLTCSQDVNATHTDLRQHNDGRGPKGQVENTHLERLLVETAFPTVYRLRLAKERKKKISPVRCLAKKRSDAISLIFEFPSFALSIQHHRGADDLYKNSFVEITSNPLRSGQMKSAALNTIKANLTKTANADQTTMTKRTLRRWRVQRNRQVCLMLEANYLEAIVEMLKDKKVALNKTVTAQVEALPSLTDETKHQEISLAAHWDRESGKVVWDLVVENFDTFTEIRISEKQADTIKEWDDSINMPDHVWSGVECVA